MRILNFLIPAKSWLLHMWAKLNRTFGNCDNLWGQRSNESANTLPSERPARMLRNKASRRSEL